MLGVALVALLVIPTSSAQAQWVTAPDDDIYYLDGKVGIGTDNPKTHLDLVGSLRLASNDDDATLKYSILRGRHYSHSKDILYFYGISQATHTYLRLGSPSTSYVAPTVIEFFTALTNTDAGKKRMTINKNGKVTIGTSLNSGQLEVLGSVDVNGTTRTEVLEITGADLAEPFEFFGAADVIPGLVASIDSERPGQLRVSTHPYDRTVVGIVSGANGIDTGVMMGTTFEVEGGTHPVALTGRVYAYADASSAAINPGDLLTSSSTPGHVMKVTDHERANGAILGKAMTSLDEGTGLILVLVNLQ